MLAKLFDERGIFERALFDCADTLADSNRFKDVEALERVLRDFAVSYGKSSYGLLVEVLNSPCGRGNVRERYAAVKRAVFNRRYG